jgi:hypothetical protein
VSGWDNDLARVARFDDFLEVAPKEEQALTFETKSVIGRPMGSPEFFGKGRRDFGTNRPAEATRRKAESGRTK